MDKTISKEIFNLTLAFAALFLSITAFAVTRISNQHKENDSLKREIEKLEESVAALDRQCDSMKIEINKQHEEQFKSCFKNEY